MKGVVKTGLWVLAMLLVGCMAAQAIIAVNWVSTEGFYKSDNQTPLLGDPEPKHALAQLIYTPTPTYDPVNLFNTNGYTSGDDVVWASYIVDNQVSDYGEFNAQTYTQAYVAGWLFIRVFDQYSHLAVTNGMWYYDSPMTQTVDNVNYPLMLPDLFDCSVMTPPFGDPLDKQVVMIPEPASWATMLLGATLLVGRKLRRK